LNAKEFNDIISSDATVIVDMRNHYESEVGHFENAICPEVTTFRESLPIISELLADKKDAPLVMYCTGGIRCEKASAYMKYKGFKEVYQLNGGIIEYARQVKANNLENKFKGKNFVFDERLGEKISDEIISRCHQCGDCMRYTHQLQQRPMSYTYLSNAIVVEKNIIHAAHYCVQILIHWINLKS
jgi:UPF0176 protein